MAPNRVREALDLHMNRFRRPESLFAMNRMHEGIRAVPFVAILVVISGCSTPKAEVFTVGAQEFALPTNNLKHVQMMSEDRNVKLDLPMEGKHWRRVGYGADVPPEANRAGDTTIWVSGGKERLSLLAMRWGKDAVPADRKSWLGEVANNKNSMAIEYAGWHGFLSKGILLPSLGLRLMTAQLDGPGDVSLFGEVFAADTEASRAELFRTLGSVIRTIQPDSK